MIKHRVIQPLTEILIKKYIILKKVTRLLRYFSQCLPEGFYWTLGGNLIVQYSDKFMPGIVL